MAHEHPLMLSRGNLLLAGRQEEDFVGELGIIKLLTTFITVNDWPARFRRTSAGAESMPVVLDLQQDQNPDLARRYL